MEVLHDSQIKAVFFHALNTQKQHLVLSTPDHMVKVWFSWGFDLYNNWFLFNRKLYGKSTKRYLLKGREWSARIQRLMVNEWTFALYKAIDLPKKWVPRKIEALLQHYFFGRFYQATQAVDVFVPVVPNEYQLFQQIGAPARYAPFTYGTLEYFLQNKIEDHVLSAQNILVGNSADPSNNHVEVFEQLARMDLSGRKVFVPLSYGGSANYRAFVIEKGVELLGDHFIPLSDFLKMEQYNAILDSCNVAIFNHVRQQAVGNIIVMGAWGAKIFINPKSTVYEFFQELGLTVFSTERLSATGLDSIEEETWRSNRRILFEVYGEAAVDRKTTRLLEIVTEEVIKKQQ
ncbi:TDP-N-acetylfucosamine:lipid II N-acetylfucosaminyltransferase [Flavobacterium caeni]|uniref:TDP-N-acetylfucosamine:lipid II N-acetylfucosaminyltransferase n=1 Tax=Flavobacterium caeni TaxID=490189 RepID=UPI00147F51D0|nr:TDP-N-acetylfucosamine:lipid II N-acetylfucosaminyltransferase [Flavobacterium caeni]